MKKNNKTIIQGIRIKLEKGVGFTTNKELITLISNATIGEATKEIKKVSKYFPNNDIIFTYHTSCGKVTVATRFNVIEYIAYLHLKG